MGTQEELIGMLLAMEIDLFKWSMTSCAGSLHLRKPYGQSKL